MKTTLLFFIGLIGCSAIAQTIALQEISTTFTNPIEMANAGDSRMFIVEQAGVVKIMNNDGTVNAANFLDISSIVLSGGERGLLGLAFHPSYAVNGFFYVYYNSNPNTTIVARYSRSTTDPNLANSASAQIIMTMNQPSSNHNGGCIRFGPDGYLYISKGDGGGSGDVNDRAQNINNILGKILRIDVNNGSPYSSPATNVFAGATPGADEIWALGLRNPWKFSFDRLTGDMWIADVGQDAIEEINKVAVLTPSGSNFGWRCYEGNAPFNTAGCSAASNYTMPFAQYTQASTGGCSVTGGYAYTGTAYPNLIGKYVFADFCNDKIGYISSTGTISWSAAFPDNNFTTFGEDINGELYVMGRSTGKLFRITDSTAGIDDFSKNSFSMYPNPSKGIVTIKSPASTTAASASIFDLTGEQVTSIQLQPTELNTIQTSQLPSGLYSITITDTSGMMHTQKLTVE